MWNTTAGALVKCKNQTGNCKVSYKSHIYDRWGFGKCGALGVATSGKIAC